MYVVIPIDTVPNDGPGALLPAAGDSAPELLEATLDNTGGMGMPYTVTLAGGLTALDLAPDTQDAVSGVPGPELYFRPQTLHFVPYTIQKDDTISKIAQDFGLAQDTLISVNGIKNSRLLQIGRMLKVPNQDGIVHTVKKGDTLSSIAGRYECDMAAIRVANELFSETINAGTDIFVPGARLDRVTLQEINGELFIWPVRSYVTSPYGYRSSPFTGKRQFHTGMDIGAPMGTPIQAAMAGRVSATGYDDISGNYVIITHHSGYRTLYAHMSVIRTKTGTYVRTGDRIGDVGSTGLSTGPHVHFTVYKNGVTVNPRILMK
ncbi:M23 family metallopeptidase [Breznakiella homolactica]|uniref:M23 family metallopeptidase n=2 Tax=Breznakiella homolactica TaxID=2798577 RepID=A0A7T7XRQ5_9SPIR|nr:M23 family metallopeptidase [Breznakiella homolactica]